LSESVITPLGIALLTATFGCAQKPSPQRKTETVTPGSAVASAAVVAPATSAAPERLSDPALTTATAEQLLARIRSAQNKATLVNVWASWCGPCREEVPMLQALSQNLARQNVAVVLVSADEPEDAPKAESFLKANQISVPSYLAARPLGPFKLGMNPRWPGMLPATFLFDSAAKLRYFWGGPVYEHEIDAVIQRLLDGSLVDGEADFTTAPGKVER